MDYINNEKPGKSALFCYLIDHFNTFHTVQSKPLDTRYPEDSHGFLASANTIIIPSTAL
jgi:hypothetical protein